MAAVSVAEEEFGAVAQSASGIPIAAAAYDCYNNGWLLQQHWYMTPARAREKLSRKAA